jgi:hypothetical protein
VLGRVLGAGIGELLAREALVLSVGVQPAACSSPAAHHSVAGTHAPARARTCTNKEPGRRGQPITARGVGRRDGAW